VHNVLRSDLIIKMTTLYLSYLMPIEAKPWMIVIESQANSSSIDMIGYEHVEKQRTYRHSIHQANFPIF
jgi:hypothetical protein